MSKGAIYGKSKYGIAECVDNKLLSRYRRKQS
ncbi:hypothetical protein BHY_1169 (plasmid) [Borrelia nietonii YOR]|uniref:Uncharacterized protein n=1 Tax=Borrelia nietonii YOR TaxID=1293576 RepID=W5SB03_9SPIR|nr:hypothetical protein BHY_1169 [Borrelia nietonii YOR]